MSRAARSAGIVLYRRRNGRAEVLLGHMGGPFWARRDERAWTIPKGEGEPGEPDEAVARREFREEIGTDVPADELVDLGDVQQSRHKVVRAFAAEGDLDAESANSTTFDLEWPRGSGVIQAFPEIDRAAWFGLDAARPLIILGQVEILDRLADHLARADV